jgi:hypothetical protein
LRVNNTCNHDISFSPTRSTGNLDGPDSKQPLARSLLHLDASHIGMPNFMGEL